MGDPRKIRRKYSSPNHPWEKGRIEEEIEIRKKYALKNKSEIWKMNSLLKGVKDQVKKLSSLSTKQAEKEREQLLKKLKNLGLVTDENKLESVLTLGLQDVIERRLQTVVFKKGMARSTKQARQFITHGHVQVGGKVVTSPSFIVLKKDEDSVSFESKSSIADNDHPERVAPKAVSDENAKA